MTTTILNANTFLFLTEQNIPMKDEQNIRDVFDVDNYINKQNDFEATKYTQHEIEEIIYNINSKKLSDFLFIDEDVVYMSNRLQKSGLYISYYDSNIKSKRQLVYRKYLRLDLESFYDNGKPKPVVDCDIRFVSFNPKTKKTGNPYNILIPKKIDGNLDKIYAVYRFFCALDGQTYTLLPSNTPQNTQTVDEYDYIEMEKNGKSYKYNISNRSAILNNSQLTISLYTI